MNVDKMLAKVFGSANDRFIKRVRPTVARINELEPEVKRLSDEQLRGKTVEFRLRLAKELEGLNELPEEEQKTRRQEVLTSMLPEAFAVVREASVRSTGMRHFDVQLIGGIVLHEGKIAEMRTGEGKTLVSTLPAYLNALTGLGVHIVTVNDYLASRDSEWMGRIHRFLGLTVGCIQNEMDDFERQEAYKADITYGTNNEFGFDYLRDNMKFELSTCVQRGHYFAVVDEVDSILIDEARTPLIISGASDESTEKYFVANDVISRMIAEQKALIQELRRESDEHIDEKTDARLLFHVDEKQHTATLTELGVERAEKLCNSGNLYEPANMDILHCINQSLKAHTLYHLDKSYVVQDGEVIIVDDFTGRLQYGRRWSDGLHQGVEAKEGVKIEKENQTLATITLQNYFRMYKKLSGMTGTAETEAAEFSKIYNLDVVTIPTNMPMVRKDNPDVIYRTLEEKWDSVVSEIQDLHGKGQPVLVGTVSVENSELIARRLKKIGVPHNVLNAKYHEREAEIIAQAGRKGAVTIATNMAGRGTDILLGGNPEFMAKESLKRQGINPDEATPEQLEEEVIKTKGTTLAEHEEVVGVGGLHILGTERHESRRIDNQLRGRAGRQGDPGSSRFFLSLEDDLMRIFAGDKVRALMKRFGMEEGVAIESKMVSKRVEAAQKSVEGHNFTIRKQLIEYDDVMNKQRETIYGLRRQLLEELNQREYILGIAEDLLNDYMDQYMDKAAIPEDWDVAGFKVQLRSVYGFDPDSEGVDFEKSNRDEVHEAVWAKLQEKYQIKEQQVGPDAMRYYERIIMLNIVDAAWKDHLLNIDHLKEGIHLRGYGQKDPLVEYKRETFQMFQKMLDRIDTDTTRMLFNLQVNAEEAPQTTRRPRGPRGRLTYTKANANAAAAGEDSDKPKTVVRNQPKIGRNDPCFCGSGLKYKKCHGA